MNRSAVLKSGSQAASPPIDIRERAIAQPLRSVDVARARGEFDSERAAWPPRLILCRNLHEHLLDPTEHACTIAMRSDAHMKHL
ncbi:MAG: hypothetical protein ACR2HE_05165 [Casimicrobiaceae bacterium]